MTYCIWTMATIGSRRTSRKLAVQIRNETCLRFQRSSHNRDTFQAFPELFRALYRHSLFQHILPSSDHFLLSSAGGSMSCAGFSYEKYITPTRLKIARIYTPARLHWEISSSFLQFCPLCAAADCNYHYSRKIRCLRPAECLPFQLSSNVTLV